MNEFGNEGREERVQDFEQVANKICEQALRDAKEQVHPLMRNSELRQLRKRNEFIQAFKLALEKRIAQAVAIWQPNVQAVFKFEESWMDSNEAWDGSLHLLVKVPQLSDAIRLFAQKLDRSLTYCLQQLGWSRFQKHRSVLEIQQVTFSELRHGTSYGAMFYAVYSVPVKIWSRTNR